MGCELPPDEVLAADQRITAWTRELRKAGLEGDMDILRARAFLDLLLGKDSRPRQDAGGEDGTGPGLGGPGSGGSGPGGPGAPPLSAGPGHGAAGFAGQGDPNPGANTSDCYRSQERADPARAAHPPRPDLPHPLPWAEMPGAQQTGWCWE